MGRKFNLRKKFGKLKLHDRKSTVEGSRRMENRDRLTCLQGEIISNILSRLEISEAVRTCVLSKSWVNKWTRITKLTCFDGFPSPKRHFLDGIENVIPKVSCMKHFSLNCFHMQDPSRLRKLVFSVLRSYPLESLAVSMISAPLSLSLCSLNKKSLTNLELKGTLSLTFTADDVFKHLKSLRLCNLTLRNIHLSSTGNVFLRMPALEDFKLIKCSFWNVENIKILAPLLSNLEVVRCTYFDLIGRLAHCIFGILGGKNMDFTYVGSFSEKFFIRKSSNNLNANLSLSLTVFPECLLEKMKMAFSARILLDNFHNSLKMLELSQEVVMVLANFRCQVLPLPVFEKLKHAKIPMQFCDTSNFDVAVEVLTNAPFLEELTISPIASCEVCEKGKRAVFVRKRGIIRGTFQRLLAGSFMVGLKRVKFETFSSWVEEVELARLFLENAPVLQELSIPVTSLAVAKKLKKQFFAFPKASENASVVFPF